VKRERAVELVQHVLSNLDAGCGEWPLSLVTQLYVFGSFARGALTPHDVDLVVERNNQDDRWLSHFVTSLSYGRDPYAVIRRELTTGKRGCQFVFETNQLEEFNALLIWERGDSLITAMDRLAAIQLDENAGRAPRDAMLPDFEGLDNWIPRPIRQVLSRAVNEGAITLERIMLQDGAQVGSEEAVMHARRRWTSSSPLYRAAMAMLAYWESQGIDPGHCHLHGTDIRDRDTPYFAGFGLRYFRSIPHCLTEFHGAEWVEVVHPTRTKLLDALRIRPLNVSLLEHADWS
jgi:hypothetical protein